MRFYHQMKVDEGGSKMHRLGASAKVAGRAREGGIKWGRWAYFHSPAVLKRYSQVLLICTNEHDNRFDGLIAFKPGQIYVMHEFHRQVVFIREGG